MKCELSNREQLIEDYIAGALSPEERDTFDEHCFNCDICFEELRLKEEMAGLIKEEGRTIFSEYLERQKVKKTGFIRSVIDRLPRLSWNWQASQWVYATVVVGTVAALCFVIAKKTISPDRTGKISQEHYASEQNATPDTVKQQQLAESRLPIQKEEMKPSPNKVEEKSKAGGSGSVDERYAENFNTSPFMEEMVNSFSVRSASVTILSPKIGESIKGDLLFRWEKIEETPVYLKILNNQALDLYNITPANNQFLFIEKLKPGLYYWKLETEEDVLFVGKFFVEE